MFDVHFSVLVSVNRKIMCKSEFFEVRVLVYFSEIVISHGSTSDASPSSSSSC